jgi:alpha-L-rhamnosidase
MAARYNMLDLRLGTWAETPEPTRSDCHAWNAPPNYDLLRIMAGIQPAAQGFKKVRIETHLDGCIKLSFDAHPDGMTDISR